MRKVIDTYSISHSIVTKYMVQAGDDREGRTESCGFLLLLFVGFFEVMQMIILYIHR